MDTTEYRYRYIDCLSARGVRYVRLCAYPVLRETPKGAYILTALYGEKFVLNGDGKRYAYETIEQAKHSYIRRKEHQLRHLETALRGCKEMLAVGWDKLPANPGEEVTSLSLDQIKSRENPHSSFFFD